MRKDYHDEKVVLVKNLVALNKKKITERDIRKAAAEVGLPYTSAKNAWLTFLESGGERIDGRQKNTEEPSKGIKMTPSHVCNEKRDSTITPKDAARIIMQYISLSKSTSRDICTMCGVSVPQFYEWLRELNVSGTLLGVKILDPRKYAKLDVKLAIWALKYPNTTRSGFDKMNELERAAYARLGQVIVKYLYALENKE